jgi:hemoglobin-like flavoprotein
VPVLIILLMTNDLPFKWNWFMTKEQIHLIENSWGHVLINSGDIGKQFYSKLFAANPDLKKLFSEDVNSQAAKLIATITFVVHKLNDVEGIMEDVLDLGRRHAKYNVKVEDFDSIARALIQTLGASMPNEWTNELEYAWIAVYRMLSETMIIGMRERKLI